MVAQSKSDVPMIFIKKYTSLIAVVSTSLIR